MEQYGSDMGWEIPWPAPAKLNLMLRIVGQRPDGYHLLQTVFQFVEWCDWLSFYPVADGTVSLANPTPGVAEHQDLIVRAARLLQQETGCTQGVRVVVDKHLPMGGGLGGGSSDAATTLVVLNRLWNTQLTTQALMALGLRLGADVPVFIYGHAAWAEGVGEQLQALQLPETWVVIIKPECAVNTKEIFADKNLTRNSKPITIAEFMAGQQNNDCLAVVESRYPQIANALSALSVQGVAKLTGTGACVFAQFASLQAAELAFATVSKQYAAYISKTVNRSSLQMQLKKLN